MDINKNRHKNPEEFRIALNNHLKSQRKDTSVQGELESMKNDVAFERLLARLSKTEDAHWVLKGGYSMNLRYSMTRGTKDIDLAFLKALDELDSNTDIRTLETQFQLQSDIKAFELSGETSDFFTFIVEEGQALTGPSADGAPKGGARYPVKAMIGNKLFTSFHVDVGIGDFPYEVENVKSNGSLGFVGIDPVFIATTSKEQQFAEKLHAYTLPRTRKINSRFKDLIDMVIMIKSNSLNFDKLKGAASHVFGLRTSHDVPVGFPAPPDAWRQPYNKMANDLSLGVDLDESYALVKRFTVEAGIMSSKHRNIRNDNVSYS